MQTWPFSLHIFRIFLNSFKINVKFWIVFILKFCEEKVLGQMSTFLKLEPNSQETAQKFEICVLQKCLRIFFDTYISVNPNPFLKIS